MTGDHDPSHDHAAGLDPAISEFRSAIERQASKLLSAAERRAQDREREAAQVARRTEADAERKAERILQAALERASVVLGAIEALEGELTGPTHGPRTEANRPTTQVDGDQAQLNASQVVDDDVVPADGELNSPATTAIRRISGELAVVPAVQMRQVLRATVSKMKNEGRTREDAQAFLTRFRVQQEHSAVLDEIFGATATSTRSAWRTWPSRRRAR
jgi:hypothetical protein